MFTLKIVALVGALNVQITMTDTAAPAGYATDAACTVRLEELLGKIKQMPVTIREARCARKTSKR